MTVTKTNVTISLTQPNGVSLDCQVFRLHYRWHGNIMTPDHPKMVLGVRKGQDAREQSVPGWIHDQKLTISPS